MRLLLTSAGLTNQTLVDKFLNLAGKNFSELSVLYIDTANINISDREWAIEEMEKFKNFGLKGLYYVDNIDRDKFIKYLDLCDVIYVQGGDNIHLLESIIENDLQTHLIEAIRSKVYVGVSAGSMLLMPDTFIKAVHDLYDENLDVEEEVRALDVLPFYLLPHLNSIYFPKMKLENVMSMEEKMKTKVYIFGDGRAVKIQQNKAEIVGEGEAYIYENKELVKLA